MTNQNPSLELESGCKVKNENSPDSCTNHNEKTPAENEEDLKPPKLEPSQPPKLTNKLTSDVEEDGCPAHSPPSVVSLNNIKMEAKAQVGADVEDRLYKLSLDDTDSGEPLVNMGIKAEHLSETKLSCDKAAKDLSNLLKTLSLGGEKPKKGLDDDVKSLLQDIDKSLEELRLSPCPSSSDKLKGRGIGDGTTDTWYSQWGGEIDLQPAADLANYFSRQQTGDLFGTTPSPEYEKTPVSLHYTWSPALSGTSSSIQNSAFDPSQSTLTNSTFGQWLHSSTGPPSSPYQSPVSYHDRQAGTYPMTTSYLDLLTSKEEPSKHLPGIPHLPDTQVPSPKRTKYMKECLTDAQPANLYTNSQTEVTQTTGYGHVLNTSVSNHDKLIPSSRSPFCTVGSPPATPVYHSPVHRLSPVSSLSSAYHSMSGLSPGMPSPSLSSSISSGYIADIAAASPQSVFSPSQSSILSDSPRSQGPNSPTDNSPSYLSPQNSPTDSGLCSSYWSPYSHVSSSGSPYSQAETEECPATTISSASFSQISTTAPVSAIPFQHRQISAPPTANYRIPVQVSQSATSSDDQVHVIQSSSPAVSKTTLHDPTVHPENLLFEYTDEDGDSILHLLVLIFENLMVRGQHQAAMSFLSYISQQFLHHPLMKQKLNKQNNRLQTPLYLAVVRNLLPLVKLLVNSGANVDIQAKCEKLHEDVPRMEGPLHTAVRFGDKGLHLVESLLSSNTANINTLNTEGETPLFVALREHGSIYVDTETTYQVKSCRKLIQALLKHGADMDVKEYKSGKTPLMVAIETKDVALVRMLLDSCDPRDLHDLLNDCTRDLNTCMHVAFGLTNITVPKHKELVRMLMMKGGEAESENNTNLKAKDMAPNVFKEAVKIFR